LTLLSAFKTSLAVFPSSVNTAAFPRFSYRPRGIAFRPRARFDNCAGYRTKEEPAEVVTAAIREAAAPRPTACPFS
jgi:hypothetical protein